MCVVVVVVVVAFVIVSFTWVAFAGLAARYINPAVQFSVPMDLFTSRFSAIFTPKACTHADCDCAIQNHATPTDNVNSNLKLYVFCHYYHILVHTLNLIRFYRYHSLLRSALS